MSTLEPGGDSIRPSDSDREQVVGALRQHLVDGRLTTDEFSERLDEVFAARRIADLRAVLRDLPAPVAQRSVSSPARSAKSAQRGQVQVFAAVMALLVGIWLVTGAGYFWPIWPLLGWGLPLAFGSGSCGRRPAAHRTPTS